MQLEGLITVSPDDPALIGRLADMMGEAFLEERWTATWLDALREIGATEERILEVSRATLRGDFLCSAPLQACYATPDEAACAGGYLASEFGDRSWEAVEEEAYERHLAPLLTPEEARALDLRAARMAPISLFNWAAADAYSRGFDDHIYFYAYGVNARKRGTGAFRRLVEPFFAYADAHGIPCYLEAYADRLVSLYGHFGFETVSVHRVLEFPDAEHCMVRLPR